MVFFTQTLKTNPKIEYKVGVDKYTFQVSLYIASYYVLNTVCVVF